MDLELADRMGANDDEVGMTYCDTPLNDGDRCDVSIAWYLGVHNE